MLDTSTKKRIDDCRDILMVNLPNPNAKIEQITTWRMGYSSSHHLSNQFKQQTGMTPTEFKKGHSRDRKPIDHIGS